MVVENVKGAQPWVGRAKWSFGSYFLWGDVPALMPIQKYHQRLKVKAGEQWNINRANYTGTRGWDENLKAADGVKVPSVSGRRTAPGLGARFTSRDCGVEVAEGRKGAGAGAEWFDQNLCKLSSKSSARKAASAKIAKIPFVLSSHIARVYRPIPAAEAA